MKFFRILRAILSPTREIARQLKILVELYELDLAARNIYRMTERASKSNTEVSYSGDDEKPRFRRITPWLTREEAANLEPDD